MVVIKKSKSHPDLLFYGRGGRLLSTDEAEDGVSCGDSISSLVDVHPPALDKTTATATTPPTFPPPDRGVIGNLLWKLLLSGELPTTNSEDGDGIDWHQLKNRHPDILSCVSVDELERYHSALTSIIILDETLDARSTALLQEYNGRLTDISSTITNELKGQAPSKFTAYVADFNDNLAYHMNQQTDAHRGIPSSPLPDSGTSTQEEWNTAVQELETNLQSKLDDSASNHKLDIQASFLKTEFQTIPQPAHVDYPWQTLEESGNNLWLAFFPLTNHGMILQLWPSLSSSNNKTASTTTTNKGQLVYVPLGKLLMVPSYTIHGGGFRTRRTHTESDGHHHHGNLRYHLYLATNGAALPKFAQNVYTMPNDKRYELSEKCCFNAKHLLRVAEEDNDGNDDSLLMELLLD